MGRNRHATARTIVRHHLYHGVWVAFTKLRVSTGEVFIQFGQKLFPSSAARFLLLFKLRCLLLRDLCFLLNQRVKLIKFFLVLLQRLAYALDGRVQFRAFFFSLFDLPPQIVELGFNRIRLANVARLGRLQARLRDLLFLLLNFLLMKMRQPLICLELCFLATQ